MTISIINHHRLMQLLHDGTNPEAVLEYMPKWVTVERLESLLANYTMGTLTPLQIAELDAILEIVPALEVVLHELKAS